MTNHKISRAGKYNAGMKATSVYFTAPGRIELREEQVPRVRRGQVLVETLVSAISAGTEMLVYRGQFPRDLSDANDRSVGDLHYPLCYGYASVGRVTALGPGWIIPGRTDRSSHFIRIAPDTWLLRICFCPFLIP